MFQGNRLIHNIFLDLFIKKMIKFNTDSNNCKIIQTRKEKKTVDFGIQSFKSRHFTYD